MTHWKPSIYSMFIRAFVNHYQAYKVISLTCIKWQVSECVLVTALCNTVDKHRNSRYSPAGERCSSFSSSKWLLSSTCLPLPSQIAYWLDFCSRFLLLKVKELDTGRRRASSTAGLYHEFLCPIVMSEGCSYSHPVAGVDSSHLE